MKIRRFSRAAACPTNSASDFGRSAASASAGVRMGVVRAGSVKMLDPLADNRDPWFQPFFVNRHGRYKSVTRLEMAERHCIGTVWAVAIPRRCAAFGAEEKVGHMAAVAGLLPKLCVPLVAYAAVWEPGLSGTGAAPPRLAVAAMTQPHNPGKT